MTGFGKASFENEKMKIIVEIKSLNSKQLDMNFKIPNLFKEKEINLRTLVSQKLQRGKVEVYISFEYKDDENVASINPDAVKNYYHQIKSIGDEYRLPGIKNPWQVIMNLPDVLKTEKKELDEHEWEETESIFLQAIDELDSFRLQEGKAMEKDIKNQVDFILAKNNEIKALDKSRVNTIKDRINKYFDEYMQDKDKIDPSRYEQEVVYFLDRLDINEELVRLENHCNYFIDSLNEDQSVGKRLNFIGQEMNREINTLGSKANDAQLQKDVVQMKESLERIKEQVMNVL